MSMAIPFLSYASDVNQQGQASSSLLFEQEEYEQFQHANARGFGRVMTKGDIKLYAICGSVAIRAGLLLRSLL